MFEPPRDAIRTPSLARQKAVLWLAFVIIIGVLVLEFARAWSVLF